MTFLSFAILFLTQFVKSFVSNLSLYYHTEKAKTSLLIMHYKVSAYISGK